MKSKISLAITSKLFTFILTLTIISLLAAISCKEDKNEIANYSYSSPSLLPRQKSPYWTATAVEDEKFFKLNSEQYKGNYLVMLFYPFDFTYVCPTELTAFSDNIQKFKAEDRSKDCLFIQLDYMSPSAPNMVV